MNTTFKITIVNTGSAPITVIGRNSLSIPAHAESSFTLPNDQQTRSLLARLRHDHPLLQISEVIPAGQGTKPEVVPPDAKLDQNKDTATTDKTASVTKGKPTAPAQE